MAAAAFIALRCNNLRYSMQKLLNAPFPFFLNDHWKNELLIFFTSLFVFLFLSIYSPFGNQEQTLTRNLNWGALCFAILYFSIIILPQIIPVLFDFSRWTVLKYILYCTGLFLFVGAFFSVANYFLYCRAMDFSEVLLKTQKEVTLTGILPLVVITVLTKNQLLQQNLADAVQTNQKLNEIRDIRDNPNKHEPPITLRTDTSETYTVKLTDFIFAAAVDNYTEIYTLNEGTVTAKLLRVTLKKVEGQLHDQFMVRCHRSYLVNVQQIENITGTINGYKLTIKNTETVIPVSRAKGKEIIAHINQMRDLLGMLH